MPMKNAPSLTRRKFIANGALAASSVAASNCATLDAAPRKGPSHKIIGFSKPFQKLSFKDTAEVTAEIGWDGIECPVRPKGQIEPERATDELPELVEALKQRGLEIGIMTTRIKAADQPHTETLLRTAAKLGIKRYRTDYWKYDRKRSIESQLDEIRPQLRELAALNKEVGIQGCYQNHSGKAYVGAPVWDLHQLIKDLDPRHMAMCFDIGHATAEGGYAWETHAQLMLPKAGAIYVKDFVWQKTEKRGWRASWRQLGKGMVNKAFFKMLKNSSFNGPISQHHEYEHGEGKKMVRMMREDLAILKRWLAEA